MTIIAWISIEVEDSGVVEYQPVYDMKEWIDSIKEEEN